MIGSEYVPERPITRLILFDVQMEPGDKIKIFPYLCPPGFFCQIFCKRN